MPAFVLSPCLPSCLLSSCCPSVAGPGTFRPRSNNVPSPVRPSVAGQSTFRRRSGGFPSQVQQRTVPGPHFCPGPATVFGILCILASPVPDKTTDRGHKPNRPGTQTLRTRDRGGGEPGTKVPRRPETEVAGPGRQHERAQKNSHREGESGRSRDDRIRTDDLFNVTEAL